jgi:hypothetical protein
MIFPIVIQIKAKREINPEEAHDSNVNSPKEK